MNFGVVVVGYQGIGKSTLANRSSSFIDLESSSFFSGDKRMPGWFIPYVNIALHIAQQGYIVFVSSHKEVRNQLNMSDLPENVRVIGCVPSLRLKESWINKLWDRWRTSRLDKDFRAYANAQDRFDDNINEIKNDCKVVCEIPSMDYNLETLLFDTLKLHGIDNGIYVLGKKIS